MRRTELKLVSGSGEAAPIDLAEILLARAGDKSVLRVVSSGGEDNDSDDAA
jgi:hypothetical protein